MNRWRFLSFLSFLGILVFFCVGCVTTLPRPNSESLSKKQINAFRSAKTVRIVVDQSYADTAEAFLPFEKVTGSLLECAGLKVVKANIKDYDAILKIHAKGEAVGNYYSDHRFRYTGVALSGIISFEVPSITPYVKSFSHTPGSYSTIDSLYGSDLYYDSSTPSSAYKRFTNNQYFPDAFRETIKEMIVEVFGLQSLFAILKIDYSPFFAWDAKYQLDKIDPNWRNSELAKQAAIDDIAALKDTDPRVRRGAAFALGIIRDSRAVEPLIDALKDEYEQVQNRAISSLRQITGKDYDFGEDPVKWQQWWEQNKDKFLEGR